MRLPSWCAGFFVPILLHSIASVSAETAQPHSRVCASKDGVVRLGINLGITHIAAACLGENNTPLPVGRIEGNDMYRAHMVDAMENDWVRFMQKSDRNFVIYGRLQDAPPNVHKGDLGSEVLGSALCNITQHSKEVLGRAVAVTSVVHPMYFNQTSKASLAFAAEQFDPSFPGHMHIRNTFRAAAFTRSDEYCTAEPAWTPMSEEPANFVIILNYDLDHLDIIVGETISTGPILHGRTVATMRSGKTSDAGTVPLALKHAIKEYLSPDESNTDSQSPLDDFHSIIITGEVTDEDLSVLSAILKEVLPEHHHKLQVSTPQYRAAFGAVCVDYLMINYPPVIFDVSIIHDEV